MRWFSSKRSTNESPRLLSLSPLRSSDHGNLTENILNDSEIVCISTNNNDVINLNNTKGIITTSTAAPVAISTSTSTQQRALTSTRKSRIGKFVFNFP